MEIAYNRNLVKMIKWLGIRNLEKVEKFEIRKVKMQKMRRLQLHLKCKKWLSYPIIRGLRMKQTNKNIH